MSDIEKIIDEAWKIKDQINKNSDKSIINAKVMIAGIVTRQDTLWKVIRARQ